MKNNKFKNNQADSFGRTVYELCSNMFRIYGNTLFDSNGANVGAGLYYEQCDEVSISHVEFKSNIAYFSGAGIVGSTSDLPTNIIGTSTSVWDNITFDHNTASFDAGVFIHSYEVMQLLFKSNTSEKHVIDAYDPSDPIVNTFLLALR